MTDAALRTSETVIPSILKGAVEAKLKARHAQERRFVLYGRLAIFIALAFLAILLGRIVLQGYTTFVDYRVVAQVYVDPAKVDLADLGGANYDMLIATSMMKKLGIPDDDLGENAEKMMSLLSNDLGFQVLNKVRADPSLIGKTLIVEGPLKADAGL